MCVRDDEAIPRVDRMTHIPSRVGLADGRAATLAARKGELPVFGDGAVVDRLCPGERDKGERDGRSAERIAEDDRKHVESYDLGAETTFKGFEGPVVKSGDRDWLGGCGESEGIDTLDRSPLLS